jgi:transcriptional regulator with XRE-family HTH domain
MAVPDDRRHMVGERLVELRGQKALTLHDLEEASGVGADAISKIENGHRKPHPATVRKLARALGVSVEDLSGPTNWRAQFLKQEAGHTTRLAEIAGRVRETLEAGELEYTARFLEILDEGLRDLAESLHEAHRIEAGKKKTATEKSIDDKLDEVLREYEAATA